MKTILIIIGFVMGAIGTALPLTFSLNQGLDWVWGIVLLILNLSGWALFWTQASTEGN